MSAFLDVITNVQFLLFSTHCGLLIP